MRKVITPTFRISLGIIGLTMSLLMTAQFSGTYSLELEV